jgi:hypothetical protein
LKSYHRICFERVSTKIKIVKEKRQLQILTLKKAKVRASGSMCAVARRSKNLLLFPNQIQFNYVDLRAFYFLKQALSLRKIALYSPIQMPTHLRLLGGKFAARVANIKKRGRALRKTGGGRGKIGCLIGEK